MTLPVKMIDLPVVFIGVPTRPLIASLTIFLPLFPQQIALKVADISNPGRPWETSKRWSELVCDEFFKQGDYERRLGLPVTPLNDRYNTSVAKIQSGEFMVFTLINDTNLRSNVCGGAPSLLSRVITATPDQLSPDSIFFG